MTARTSDMLHRETLPYSRDGEPMWVFGYGSLMWDPGMPYAECHNARLWGYHRGLCIYSHTYRGTPEKPGLVFGLDHGGSCAGRAFLIRAKDIDSSIDYLYGREMVNNVYRPTMAQVDIENRGRQRALVFVADPSSSQYCRGISEHETARLLNQGVGPKGTSFDYVANTLAHMREIGIRDRALERILRLAENARRET